MSTYNHERASELFLIAVDLDPAGRPAFLQRECNGDDALRSRIETLLRHDGQSLRVLDTGSMLNRAEEELRASPESIGPYRIVDQIGEGGMGIVYRADQQAPIRRRVALKLIKRGLETEEVLRRFDTERQVLALMDHPGIARVLDSGTTDLGRPYFAMEYVKGEPITDFCDRHRLDIGGRLQLFLRVCESVEHAHQNAIIHRDLKPSNVLVTRVSGRPVPKIIDFGIAKALSQDWADRSLTQIGQIVGTLEYMSPEQAAMMPQGIDTRADVYSMGAVLYELLAGSAPFDHASLRDSSFDEARRRIREEDPVRPSAWIAGSDDAGTAARARGSSPASLARRLRGDLDCILMKTLEKDRSRRYGSVAALAADIRRHLRDEPIEARPPGGIYRLGKLIRKHRAVAASVAVLLPLLIGFAATMTVQAGRISQERDRAEEISEFLVRFYDVPFIVLDRHRNPEAESVLLDSAAKIAELDDRPRLQARLNQQMGRVLAAVGRADVAESMFQSAHEKLTELGETGHPQSLAAQHDLAMVRWMRRDAGAESLVLDAVAARRHTLGDRNPDTLRAMIDAGHMLKRAGQSAEAMPWFELAVAGMREVHGPDHMETKIATALYASVLLDLHRFDEVVAILTELIPKFEGSNPEIYIAIYNLACAHAGLGDHENALATLRHAVDRGFWSGIRADLFWENYRDDPEFIELGMLSELRYDVVQDRVGYMADVYRHQGRVKESAAIYETILDKVPLQEPQRSDWELRLASTYIELGRYEDAEPLILNRIDQLSGTFTNFVKLADAYWFLVQARLGRNDVSGALAAMDAQEAVHDVLRVSSPYNRAMRAALVGDSEAALSELREAMRRGFADIDKLHRDLALKPLQGSTELDALVEEIRRRSWVPSDLSLDLWFRLGVMPAIPLENSAVHQTVRGGAPEL